MPSSTPAGTLTDSVRSLVTRPAPAHLSQGAQFEQELPFGVVVDALDDQVEASLPGLAERLGAETAALLATVLPALRAAGAAGAERDRPAQRSGRSHRADRPGQ